MCDTKTKECRVCGEEKPLTSEYFYSRKDNKDGFRNDCKECNKSITKKYYQNNTEKISKRHKEYYYNRGGKEKKKISSKKWVLENKEQIRTYQKKWVTENKEKVKGYQKKYYENGGKEKRYDYIKNNKDRFIGYQRKYDEKNKDKRRQKSKRYYLNNKEIINKKKYIHYKKRLIEDELFRIKESIRHLLKNSFINQGYTKMSRTHEILGCDWKTFKRHIENQFQHGMTWDNHGEWHYDHIIPISSAETEEDVYRLNHYTNFQPLWAEDNLRKSDKISEEWGNVEN